MALALGVCLAVPGWAQIIRSDSTLSSPETISKVGEASKFASEMFKERVNVKGGLKVGNKTYKLDFVYQDNEAKGESAAAAATKLITRTRSGGHWSSGQQAGHPGGEVLRTPTRPS